MAHFGPGFAGVINNSMEFDLARHETEKKLLWLRIKTKGKFLRGDKQEGYLYRGKFYMTHTWSEFERGDLYKPSQCDCGIPPWETCRHSIY